MIKASAPFRICDIGGWTDTWFGGPGRVVNIAVTPGIEISIRKTAGPDPVVLNVETFGDRYPLVPGVSRRARHPVLEAAVDMLAPPDDLAVEISVRSGAPPGSGVGSSAAVAVALLGGLAAMRSEQLSQHDIAYAAHRLEVDTLGAQSGIQDQLSAAYGGINYLEIEPYPKATVQTLPPWDELSRRLTLIFLGRAHDSSNMHRQVIEHLQCEGSGLFTQLRDAATAARDAVIARDLNAFGQATIANTDAQRALHPELVGEHATRVIEHAQTQGAIGWKVNGAGGNGGSLTIVSDTPEAKGALERRITQLDTRYQVLPIQTDSAGLQVDH